MFLRNKRKIRIITINKNLININFSQSVNRRKGKTLNNSSTAATIFQFYNPNTVSTGFTVKVNISSYIHCHIMITNYVHNTQHFDMALPVKVKQIAPSNITHLTRYLFCFQSA